MLICSLRKGSLTLLDSKKRAGIRSATASLRKGPVKMQLLAVRSMLHTAAGAAALRPGDSRAGPATVKN